MAMNRKEDFQFFFHHRNSIPAKQVIETAKRLIRNTPKSENLFKKNIIVTFASYFFILSVY